MPKPPNLLFVFPDQFRQQSLGFMNADPVVTPNLDRLASEGLVFTRAVSNYPVCSPYRAMLFSGQYPFRNGVTANCYKKTVPLGIELPADTHCLSDVLADSGYATGYIGKWHLDLPRKRYMAYTGAKPGQNPGLEWDSFTPPERRHGFEFWYSYGCCNEHLAPHYWVNDAPLEARIDVNEWSVKHETDVAIRYINNESGQRDPEKPFALFVAFNPPHTPFDRVPPQYLEPYRDRSPEELLNRPNVTAEGQGRRGFEHVKNYFAAVTGIDENIGRLMDALEARGLRENTIVVFTADHGEMLASHGLMGKNVAYDESLLVPFIVRWPGVTPAGATDDLLLGAPDAMPSLLGLMGLPEAIPDEVEGRDYSPAFRGDALPERPTSAFYLNVNPELDTPEHRGLRTHKETFVVERDVDGAMTERLFDNEEDPYQMKDVAVERPERIEELRCELNRWLERTGDSWVDDR